MIYKCETTYNGGKDLDGLFFDEGKGILIVRKEFNAEKINLEFPDGSNRLMSPALKNSYIFFRDSEGKRTDVKIDMVKDADIWEGFLGDDDMSFSIIGGILFYKNHGIVLLGDRIKGNVLDLRDGRRIKRLKSKFGNIGLGNNCLNYNYKAAEKIEKIIIDDNIIAFINAKNLDNLKEIRIILTENESGKNNVPVFFLTKEQKRKTKLFLFGWKREKPDDFSWNDFGYVGVLIGNCDEEGKLIKRYRE